MRPLLCHTVTGATTAELVARRDAADADLVELRLDGVREPDVRAAVAGRRVPVIVTCRPAWEGGRYRGSEADRRSLLEQAVESGAEFVDVEWRAGWEDLVARRQGRGIVLSLHDFDGIPADLRELHARMRGTGAEVVKIAVTAKRLCDSFALEDVLGGAIDAADGERRGLVFIAMGESGLITRILPARFGSAWTYGGSEAPGQISAERLVAEFRFREIGPAPAVYGIVGNHAAQSLSPALHNPAFRRGGADALFVPLQTDDFDDFLAFAGRLPLAGAAVTMPFKEIAMRRATVCDEIARTVGAVNTLRRLGAGWAATNTDVSGFMDPIRDVELEGRRVAIVGAGGAARAVSVAMARAGAKVTVYARRRDRAEAVAALARGRGCEGLPDKGSWDVLVNATPVGSAPDMDRTPVPADRLDGQLVYDLVYQPRETRLVREARAAGCRGIGGFDMLVAQAGRQREWWGLAGVPC